MADNAQNIDTIGVGLTLDTSGFDANLAKSRTALASFERTRAATLRAPQTMAIAPMFKVTQAQVRGLRVDINQHMTSMAARNEAVAIPVKLGQSDWAGMRQQISQKIGTVPVSVSIAGGGTGSLRAGSRAGMAGRADPVQVLAAWIATTQGLSLPNANTQLIRAARSKGIAGRAAGGPVVQDRDYLVGEQGPEVVRFKRPAVIEPASRGKRVQARGGKYGDSNIRYMAQRGDEAKQMWLDVPHDPRYVYHSTHQVSERHGSSSLTGEDLRRRGGRYGQGIAPTANNWAGTYRDAVAQGETDAYMNEFRKWRGPAGTKPVSFWASNPIESSGYGARLLRTRRTRDFSQPFGYAGPAGEADLELKDPEGYYQVTPKRKGMRDLEYYGYDDQWHRFRRGRARAGGGTVKPISYGPGFAHRDRGGIVGQFAHETLSEFDLPRVPQGMVRILRGGRRHDDEADKQALIHHVSQSGVYGPGIYAGLDSEEGRRIAFDYSKSSGYRSSRLDRTVPGGQVQTGLVPSSALLHLGGETIPGMQEQYERWLRLRQKSSRSGRYESEILDIALSQLRDPDPSQFASQLGFFSGDDMYRQFQRHLDHRGYQGATFAYDRHEPQRRASANTALLWDPRVVQPEVFDLIGGAARYARGGRINRRSGGGLVNPFTGSGVEAELDYAFRPPGTKTQSRLPHRIGPLDAALMGRMRQQDIEHHLLLDPTASPRGWGQLVGLASGDEGSVDPDNTRRPHWMPTPEVNAKFWGATPTGVERPLSLAGLVGMHNHPTSGVSKGMQTWRPSDADILTFLDENEQESWVGTPNWTSIMRRRRDTEQVGPISLMSAMQRGMLGRYSRSELKDPGFLNGPEVSGNYTMWKEIMADIAGSAKFDFELWKHPTRGGGEQLSLNDYGRSRGVVGFNRGGYMSTGGAAARYGKWAQERHEAAGGRGRLKITDQEIASALRGTGNVKDLIRLSQRNDPALSQAGREWYTEQPQIHDFEGRARSLGVTLRQFVDVVALMSSGAAWYADKSDAFSAAGVRRPVAGPNITTAESVIRHLQTGSGPTGGATGDMIEDARRYFGGVPMTAANFGPKRPAFADAFFDPNAFPIDRWQGRATTLGERHGVTFPKSDESMLETLMGKAVKGRDWSSADAPTPSQRRASVYAVSEVAKLLGMEPRGVQAESWTEIKRLEGVGNKLFRLDKKSGLALPRQGGGRVDKLRSLEDVKAFHEAHRYENLYQRWTPSIRRDMQPGAHSTHLDFWEEKEPGISVNRFPFFEDAADRIQRPHGYMGYFDDNYDFGPARRGDWDYRLSGSHHGHFTGRGDRAMFGGKSNTAYQRNRNPGMWRPPYFSHRNLWLMGGDALQDRYGSDGEPLLEPTSIRPLAIVSRNAVNEDFLDRWPHNQMADWVRERYEKQIAERKAKWARYVKRNYRAQGGPAKAGGLPRGFDTFFWEENEETGSYKDYEKGAKPPRWITHPQDRRTWTDSPRVIGVGAQDKHGAGGISRFRFDGELHPLDTAVEEAHQRKGLATAMYAKLERWTGRNIVPGDTQSDDGFGLWQNPRRPFGKRRAGGGKVGGPGEGILKDWDQAQKLTYVHEMDNQAERMLHLRLDPRFAEDRLAYLKGGFPPLEGGNAGVGIVDKRTRSERAELFGYGESNDPLAGIDAALRRLPKTMQEPGMSRLHGYRKLIRDVLENSTQFSGETSYDNPRHHIYREHPTGKWEKKDTFKELSHYTPYKNAESIYPGPWDEEAERRKRGMAGGGNPQGAQTYLVGELQPELFIPDRMRYIIPPDVMDKLPKRAGGGETRRMGNSGVTEVGTRGPHLFTPPEDGWIIPHTLVGRVNPLIPRAARGMKATDAAWLGLDRDKFQDAAASLSDYGENIIEGMQQDLAGAAQAISGRTFSSAAVAQATAGGRQGQFQRGLIARQAIGQAQRAYREGAPAVAAMEQAQQRAPQVEAIRARLERERADRLARNTSAYTPRALQANETRIRNLTAGIAEADKALAGYAEMVTKGEKAQAKINETTENAVLAGKAAQPSTFAKLANLGQVMGAQFIAAQVVMSGISKLIEGAQPGVERWVDSLTGFAGVNAAVTTELGAASRQRGGRVEETVAAAGLGAGVSSSAINMLVEKLSLGITAKGAAQAEAEVGKLFKAAAGNQAPTGLYGGYGGVLGTSFLGESMGGGRGFTETIRSNVEGLTGVGGGQDYGADFELALDFLTNPKFRDAVVAKAPDNPAVAATDAFLDFDPYKLGQEVRHNLGWDKGDVGAGAPSAAGSMADFRASERASFTPAATDNPLGLSPEALQVTSAYLNDLTMSAGRGAKALGEAADVTWDYAKSQDERNKATDAALAAADPEGVALAQQGIIMRNQRGDVVSTKEEYQRGVELTARGRSIPDVNTWAKTIGQALRGSREATGEQLANDLAVSIPASLDQALAQNPLQSRRQILREIGPLGQLEPQERRRVRRQATVAAGENRALEERAEVGRTAAVGFITQNLDATQATAYSDALDQATGYGREILQLQTRISRINMAQRAKEFVAQMILANRALQDALGLAGRGGSQFGQLQRQDYFLGRESQSLSMGLQQKQINFQVATAGFTAQGVTGEEVAAKQTQAKIEASYAQQQLDIEKERFGIALQMFNISNERAVNDARRSRDLLAASYENEKVMAAIVKEIKAKEIAQQEAMQRAQSIFQAANKNYSEILGEARGYVAQFGGTIRVATEALRTVLGFTDRKTTPDGGGNADGFLGTVTGATNMLMGEAGTETVAILRNPRTAAMPSAPAAGGGGPTVLTINMVGAVVRDDADVQKIAAAIEERINRRVGLLGLRTPGG